MVVAHLLGQSTFLLAIGPPIAAAVDVQVAVSIVTTTTTENNNDATVLPSPPPVEQPESLSYAMSLYVRLPSLSGLIYRCYDWFIEYFLLVE